MWCFPNVFVSTSKLKSVLRKLLPLSKWSHFTRQLSCGSSGDWLLSFLQKCQTLSIFEHFTVSSSWYQTNFTFLKFLKTLIQCSQASWFHCFNTMHLLKSEKSNNGKAETTHKSELILICLTKKLWFLNCFVSTSKRKSVLRKSSPTSKWSIITSNFPVVPRETDWSMSSKRV